jgi:hypothetical protein
MTQIAHKDIFILTSTNGPQAAWECSTLPLVHALVGIGVVFNGINTKLQAITMQKIKKQRISSDHLYLGVSQSHLECNNK